MLLSVTVLFTALSVQLAITIGTLPMGNVNAILSNNGNKPKNSKHFRSSTYFVSFATITRMIIATSPVAETTILDRKMLLDSDNPYMSWIIGVAKVSLIEGTKAITPIKKMLHERPL